MDGNKENVRARGWKGRKRRIGVKVRRGATTLGSGNPGLPISSLLLIHSNCICSQIYILFSGFPSFHSSLGKTTTTTRHACLYTVGRKSLGSRFFTCKVFVLYIRRYNSIARIRVLERIIRSEEFYVSSYDSALVE